MMRIPSTRRSSFFEARVFTAAAVLTGLVAVALLPGGPQSARAAEAGTQAAAGAANQASGDQHPADDTPFDVRPSSAKLPYDTEYPAMGYSGPAANNPIARLQARLDKGEVKLEFRPGRGYLDSLLKALDIDPSSQSLVYSKTSLQVGSIRAATPRAIYFNEDTYVAWVQGSDQMELAAMDTSRGQVFYILRNQEAPGVKFDRQQANCLSCHDTYSLSGGGVPRFLLMSSYVDVGGNQLTHEGSILVTDQTEIRYRWGGWYVTGHQGNQVHLGNIQVRNVQELVHLDQVRRGNLDTLDGLFDTKPYLTNKSDIVAQLVLLHQVTVDELITRVNFEVRNALAKAAKGGAASGSPALPADTGKAVKEYMDALVDAMLFVDAARYTDTITGNSGFDQWFQARGPHDPSGRSLRELDLHTRLFKYPLSYLVYSPAFDALPKYATDYIYKRFADVLSGRDQDKKYAHRSPEDRKAVLAILKATKPAFVPFAGH
jgi:hypothetical protein